LMFLVAKMKKLETFKFGRRMDPKHNLGSLFTLLMLRKSKQRDWTRTLDLRLRDHSTLSQNCGWTELLNVLEHQTLSLRLSIRIELHNNSS
jgi:hypothetical protein